MSFGTKFGKCWAGKYRCLLAPLPVICRVCAGLQVAHLTRLHWPEQAPRPHLPSWGPVQDVYLGGSRWSPPESGGALPVSCVPAASSHSCSHSWLAATGCGSGSHPDAFAPPPPPRRHYFKLRVKRFRAGPLEPGCLGLQALCGGGAFFKAWQPVGGSQEFWDGSGEEPRTRLWFSLLPLPSLPPLSGPPRLQSETPILSDPPRPLS